MMIRLSSNLLYKNIKFGLVSRSYSVTVLFLLVLLIPGLAMSQQADKQQVVAVVHESE